MRILCLGDYYARKVFTENAEGISYRMRHQGIENKKKRERKEVGSANVYV